MSEIDNENTVLDLTKSHSNAKLNVIRPNITSEKIKFIDMYNMIILLGNRFEDLEKELKSHYKCLLDLERLYLSINAGIKTLEDKVRKLEKK